MLRRRVEQFYGDLRSLVLHVELKGILTESRTYFCAMLFEAQLLHQDDPTLDEIKTLSDGVSTMEGLFLCAGQLISFLQSVGEEEEEQAEDEPEGAGLVTEGRAFQIGRTLFSIGWSRGQQSKKGSR